VQCVPGASLPGSPGVGSTPASGSVDTGGWSNVRSLGCLAAAALACATSDAPALLQGLLHLACALLCLRSLAPETG